MYVCVPPASGLIFDEMCVGVCVCVGTVGCGLAVASQRILNSILRI